MRNQPSFLLLFSLGLLFVTTFVAETKAADDDEPLPMKIFNNLEEGKQKVADIEDKLQGIADDLGPEGKKIYAKLKAIGRSLLKKGVSWFRSKFGGAPAPAEDLVNNKDMKRGVEYPRALGKQMPGFEEKRGIAYFD